NGQFPGNGGPVYPPATTNRVVTGNSSVAPAVTGNSFVAPAVNYTPAPVYHVPVAPTTRRASGQYVFDSSRFIVPGESMIRQRTAPIDKSDKSQAPVLPPAPRTEPVVTPMEPVVTPMVTAEALSTNFLFNQIDSNQ
ncbi:unnamed protein product, partial [Polarella glacialis]